MPFDRLVRAVDEWAGACGRTDVIAQVGASDYRPKHLEWHASLEAETYARMIQEASVIIGHAGMGTIITALEHRKPLVVLPRRGDLMETRNDHQVATARRFAERGTVHVAMDEEELLEHLSRVDDLPAPPPTRSSSLPGLLQAIRSFVLHP